MKISTKGRYASRAMLDLASNFNKKPVLLKNIAKRQDISVRYLEHIMTTLVSAGLVQSIRGKQGGFTLAKSPEKIQLGQVITAVEGSLALVDCVDNPNMCKRMKQCIIRDIWVDLKKCMTDLLDSITLQDMVEMQRQKNPDSDRCMYYI
ncbi:MAG: RrF2 family transcriptional regulator [Endomicrobiales bacterium]|nr:RrF2 family transcriptional regulator [Endomicrobiales bacterium]